MKNKGQPWERAKAFDGSCVLAEWVDYDPAIDLDRLTFRFAQNGVVKQQGNTQDMIFDIATLLADISQVFTLEEGDVVMTGTPAGVAALQSGDQLTMTLQGQSQDFVWKTFVQ